MGVRILSNEREHKAVLYDSVTDVAFGPVFYDLDESEAGGEDVFAEEVAEAFLRYLTYDARNYGHDKLMREYDDFRAVIENDGWAGVVGEEVSA